MSNDRKPVADQAEDDGDDVGGGEPAEGHGARGLHDALPETGEDDPAVLLLCGWSMPTCRP